MKTLDSLLNALLRVRPHGWSVTRAGEALSVRPPERSVCKFKLSFLRDGRLAVSRFDRGLNYWTDAQYFEQSTLDATTLFAEMQRRTCRAATRAPSPHSGAMTAPDQIMGADRLLERFGGWPSFHDAEVVRLSFDRRGDHRPTAEMLVHAWLMTDKVDDRGYYVLEKHTLVRFVFERLASCEIAEFNHQNVLFGLQVTPETVDGEAAFRVTLDPSYGLTGSLVCGRVVVADVTPCDERGEPTSP
jgi:hypothetical protein